ncbi:10955_t:CDS:2 [Dentiscutata erythropus]|uniref:10955_t:CDS:1 n=1 Tax=Dentiscutata erythropus TaxID=1348616 RepID=A0A9N8VMH1_9GLOM|nr:10955_t:CDS:2 [Dentiscutata erythropus]
MFSLELYCVERNLSKDLKIVDMGNVSGANINNKESLLEDELFAPEIIDEL